MAENAQVAGPAGQLEPVEPAGPCALCGGRSSARTARTLALPLRAAPKPTAAERTRPLPFDGVPLEPVEAPPLERPALAAGDDEGPSVRPPVPAFVEADELAGYIVEGRRRYGWSDDEAEYVRGVIGLVRARMWRAAKATLREHEPARKATAK